MCDAQCALHVCSCGLSADLINVSLEWLWMVLWSTCKVHCIHAPPFEVIFSLTVSIYWRYQFSKPYRWIQLTSHPWLWLCWHHASFHFELVVWYMAGDYQWNIVNGDHDILSEMLTINQAHEVCSSDRCCNPLVAFVMDILADLLSLRIYNSSENYVHLTVMLLQKILYDSPVNLLNHKFTSVTTGKLHD